MPDPSCPDQPQRFSLPAFAREVSAAFPHVVWTRFGRRQAGFTAEADIGNVRLEVTFSADEAPNPWGVFIDSPAPTLAKARSSARAVAEPAEGEEPAPCEAALQADEAAEHLAAGERRATLDTMAELADAGFGPPRHDPAAIQRGHFPDHVGPTGEEEGDR